MTEVVAIGRYMGGKIVLASQLLPFFPQAKTYYEGCMGFFTLGLNYPFPCDRVAYDLNPRTINLLRVIRDLPSQLVDSISNSPRDIDSLKACWEVADDPMEDARRYWWVAASTFNGGGSRWSSGITKARLKRCHDITAEHLWVVSERLQGVSIVQGDGLLAAPQHDAPDTLFYLDPTYENSVRGSKDNRVKNPVKALTRNQYAYETNQQDLLQVALELQGMVIVSGYPNSRYDDALKGWITKDFQVLDSARKPRIERIWINPKAWGALRWKEFSHATQLKLELVS
ncbi:MAG: DNA adenine methylase [Leptolyngbya sp. SIO1D8]|nr:DNA adenine methylase [Leptolyngbya sp. SIO1D8]